MRKTRSWFAAALGFLCLGACGTEVPANTGLEDWCGPGGCDPKPDDDADDPVDDDEDEVEDDDDGGGDDPDDDDGDDPATGNGLPCEVQDVLVQECGMCHGTPPSFGAPMALSTWDDLQRPAVTDVTRPVFELVGERLLHPSDPMPPDGSIEESDAQVVLDWIDAGAPEDPDADCGDSEPEPPTVGPDALDCDADITLTAHAPGSEDGFVVPAVGADNLYQCFAFPVPTTATGQATAWAPIIDDERVVHHWILYRQGNQPNGGDVFPCDSSLQVTATFVAGWAPGGENMEMPEGVGLELGDPGDWYVLQIHYNNTAGYDDVVDKSGVAFCSADAPQPNTAGILTLGTVGINIPAGAVNHQESGTCGWFSTAGWPEPLHVIAGSPHMHELGTAFQTVVNRQGGGTEMLTDVPIFDFNNQGMWVNDPEVIINPGDSLVSTCTFDNPNNFPVGFGEGTNDEMCFNFVLAYPIQGLSNRNCGIIF